MESLRQVSDDDGPSFIVLSDESQESSDTDDNEDFYRDEEYEESLDTTDIVFNNLQENLEALRKEKDLLQKLVDDVKKNQASQKDKTAIQSTLNVSDLLQGYYKSLNSLSWRGIQGTLLGFLLAFVLLWAYGAIIHSQEMEKLKIKESEVLRLLQDQENLRENIRHQEYEEKRIMNSSVTMCNAQREELRAQLLEMGKNAGMLESELKVKLSMKSEEVKSYEKQLNDLRKKHKQENDAVVKQIHMQLEEMKKKLEEKRSYLGYFVDNILLTLWSYLPAYFMKSGGVK